MQFFQKFDHTKQLNPNTPLSIVEKSSIMALLVLCKIILRKIRKANTYGDIYKIMNYVNTKIDFFDKKYEHEESSSPAEIIKDMINTGNEINEM